MFCSHALNEHAVKSVSDVAVTLAKCFSFINFKSVFGLQLNHKHLKAVVKNNK